MIQFREVMGKFAHLLWGHFTIIPTDKVVVSFKYASSGSGSCALKASN